MKQNLQIYKWFALVAKTGDKDAAQSATRSPMRSGRTAGARPWRRAVEAELSIPAANSPTSLRSLAGRHAPTTQVIDMKKAVQNIQLSSLTRTATTPAAQT